MSPEYYNMSQPSSGLNNIYANKFSRKLSQATGSYIEGNSNNKFGNLGSFGENDINDAKLNIPYNENNISNDDYLNNFTNINNNYINNETISNKPPPILRKVVYL